MSGIHVQMIEPNVGVVALRGEHEAFSADRLSAQLCTLQEEGCALVIDLTETTFIDSSIVSVLLRARDSARSLGVPLVIVLHEGTGWAVRRLFEMTGLDHEFTFAPTRDAAVAAVAAA
jgi:anti-anti-sigma factor